MAQAPRPLADMVLGASKRSTIEFQLGGDAYQGMPVFSAAPYVLWPLGEAKHAPAHEQAAVAAWLDAAATELGVSGFQARFVESWEWRDATVWSYALSHRGLDLWRARIQVLFSGDRFIGMALDVPQPLLGIEPFEADASGVERVLDPVREESGYRAVAKTLQTSQSGNLTITTVGNQQVVTMTQFPPASLVPLERFDEWTVPIGTFPDQIDLDANGKVWFSQPNNNFLTRFDPVTEVFTQFATTGGSGPDGMRVDSQGRKWSGLYFGGGLGRLATNGVHTNYPAPYAPANMAIPLESSLGTIWITDHQNNRISEFNPVTSTWLGSYVMPTPNCWVVEGHEDVANGVIYYSCYNANKLAYKPHGQAIAETATLGSGPAFPVVSNGKVYYSLWNSSALGAYNIQTGQHQLFPYPLGGEPGGPIAATGDGRIVVGTRGAGYIMVFHPNTSTFDAYKIPTVFSGNMKDGITTGPNGVVWFTETYANKIARLRLP